MKTNSLIQNLLIVILVSCPFLYAAWIWDKLPESVPTQFGIDRFLYYSNGLQRLGLSRQYT